MDSAIAIITARGGSKGLPGKNLRLLDGKPLIHYTIDAALNCPNIKGCYVTTDDPNIKKVSLESGAEVIDRPAELATDTSSSQDAVVHSLSWLCKRGLEPNVFALLQPTSPLRTASHLQECLEVFFSSGAVSSSSVTEAEHHPLKMLLDSDGTIMPVKDALILESPRQILPTAYRINGAIYVMKTRLFLKKRLFFEDPYVPYVMSSEDSLDIDTESDLLEAEKIILRRKGGRQPVETFREK